MIDQRRAPDDHRQAQTRKGDLLHHRRLLDEDSHAAREDFAEQRPRRHPGQKIDRIGGGAVRIRKPCLENFRKHDREDHRLSQRVKDEPKAAQTGPHKTSLQIASDRGDDEMAILPKASEHSINLLRASAGLTYPLPISENVGYFLLKWHQRLPLQPVACF